jgi:Acetyltransferase (GNAT) domain
LIEVRRFSRLDELAFLRESIDQVNLASPRPDPFSTFAFYENFVRNDEFAPPRGWTLWFLAAFVDGALVGYLPLKQSQFRAGRLRAARVDFLVTHDTDRPHVVAEAHHLPAVCEAFYRYLLAHKREWSQLEFQQQDSTSPLWPPPIALNGCLLREWPSLENGTIVVRWVSLEAYFRSFSKKFRSNVSRQMRTLLDSGEVEVLSSSDPAVTPDLFALCLSIEPRSWKSQADASVSRHPKRIEYFHGLLDPRQPMRLSVHVVLLNDLPIAGLVTGRFDSNLYALHIVYDETRKNLAPGSAVLLLGMRQAILSRCREFNLLSGFAYYKERWLADITPARNAQIYRVGSLLYWRRLFGDLKRRLARSRPDHADPGLFNPVRRKVESRSHDEDAPQAQVSPEERTRVAALIEDIRTGPCEYLSHASLAAIMPFDTRH